MAETPDLLERHALLRVIHDRLVKEGFTRASANPGTRELKYEKQYQDCRRCEVSVRLADNDLPTKDKVHLIRQFHESRRLEQH